MNEASRTPRPVASDWEWQFDGACRELPSEMFFHPDGERGPSRRNRENTAKAICATCPVIEACRKHALALKNPPHLWRVFLLLISGSARQVHVSDHVLKMLLPSDHLESRIRELQL